MAQQQQAWDRTLPGAVTTSHVYATVGDRDLGCHLHRPLTSSDSSSSVPLPIIVWVHGSGFFGGPHLLGTPPGFTCPSMIDHGYAILQVEHRSSTEAGGTFPAGVHDVKAAVRWVRQLAASDALLHLDPDRIGVWGASSGGYYSAMTAVLSSPTVSQISAVSAA
jgi:acetyl esterase/lipase